VAMALCRPPSTDQRQEMMPPPTALSLPSPRPGSTTRKGERDITIAIVRPGPTTESKCFLLGYHHASFFNLMCYCRDSYKANARKEHLGPKHSLISSHHHRKSSPSSLVFVTKVQYHSFFPPDPLRTERKELPKHL